MGGSGCGRPVSIEAQTEIHFHQVTEEDKEVVRLLFDSVDFGG